MTAGLSGAAARLAVPRADPGAGLPTSAAPQRRLAAGMQPTLHLRPERLPALRQNGRLAPPGSIAGIPGVFLTKRLHSGQGNSRALPPGLLQRLDLAATAADMNGHARNWRFQNERGFFRAEHVSKDGCESMETAQVLLV